jgi:hypothetical protein
LKSRTNHLKKIGPYALIKIPTIAFATLAVLSLFILYEYSTTTKFPEVSAQNQERVLGSGAGNIMPNNIPTLFSFEVTKIGQKTSGHFECFAVMPDGKTMFVNGTITGLDISGDRHNATITGQSIVTGMGAGSGPFKAVVTPGGSGTSTLKLTTDINGDGKLGDMSDGSEGPFNENVTRGSIQIGK